MSMPQRFQPGKPNCQRAVCAPAAAPLATPYTALHMAGPNAPELPAAIAVAKPESAAG